MTAESAVAVQAEHQLNLMRSHETYRKNSYERSPTFSQIRDEAQRGGAAVLVVSAPVWSVLMSLGSKG